MGVFDEIIRTVQEAMEQARAENQRRATPPALPTQRVTPAQTAVPTAQRAAPVTRPATMPVPAKARPAPPVDAARARIAQGASPSDAARRQTTMARRQAEQRVEDAVRLSADVAANEASSAHLLAMLRDPRAMRDAIVLSEILAPPLALRRRRRSGPP